MRISEQYHQCVRNVVSLIIFFAIANDSFARREGEDLFEELRRALRDREGAATFQAKCNVDMLNKAPKRVYKIVSDGQFMLESFEKNSVAEWAKRGFFFHLSGHILLLLLKKL